MHHIQAMVNCDYSNNRAIYNKSPRQQKKKHWRWDVWGGKQHCWKDHKRNAWFPQPPEPQTFGIWFGTLMRQNNIRASSLRKKARRGKKKCRQSSLPAHYMRTTKFPPEKRLSLRERSVAEYFSLYFHFLLSLIFLLSKQWDVIIQ